MNAIPRTSCTTVAATCSRQRRRCEAGRRRARGRAAVLDALGAALHQLTHTATALESATADAARGAREDQALRARARMRFSLWDLELHLRKARDAADQAQRRSADASAARA